MATEKVGIYRKYYGKVPTDKSGKPLPKSNWPKKRAFSWVVRWFSSDGKRYSKSFKTRKEAERYAEMRQTDCRSGKTDLPQSVNIKQFYQEHKDLVKHNLSKATLYLHLRVIKLFAEQVGWNCQLKRVKSRDIEKYRAARLKAGISPATANKELKVLKRIFNLAILREYTAQDSNPCVPVSLIKIAPKKPNYCSPQEFTCIYNKSPDIFWKAFLTTAYTTAQRLQEMLNLTWGDIDFQRNQVCVTRKDGGKWIQPWQPKDCEMRLIPLPDQTVNLLTAWQSVAPEKCPYVFMEHERWEYYREKVDRKTWNPEQSLMNNVLRRYKTICRHAGVGPFSIHDLRRSCITNWAQYLPIHVVQQLAGHSDIKTTQQFYLSVQDEDINKARRIQSKLLGKIPEVDLTDPKVTHFGKNRAFPGKRAFS